MGTAAPGAVPAEPTDTRAPAEIAGRAARPVLALWDRLGAVRGTPERVVDDGEFFRADVTEAEFA